MSRRRGNDFENQVCEMAEALGYCAFPARGSRGVIDIVCFESTERKPGGRLYQQGSFGNYGLPGQAERSPEFIRIYENYGKMPPLAIQVGTTAKPISRTLDELEKAPRPIGSLVIVARRVRAKNRRISWLFHTRAGKYTSLSAAIDGRES